MFSTTLSMKMSPARAFSSGLLLLVILSSISSVLVLARNSYEQMRAFAAADSNSESIGYEVEMMHIDHHDSPVRTPANGMLTPSKADCLKYRYADAAKRSMARANSLHQKQQQSAAPAPTPHAGTAEVFSQQGEYIMDLTIGTPAKKYTTIVDTGSDLVWVQCRPCSDCFQQPDPLFDPSKSSTYTRVNCTSHFCSSLFLAYCENGACIYNYGYGDGSYTDGDLSLETLTVTSTRGAQLLQVPNFAFGCGTSDGGDFSSSDGLVGLGNGTLSMMTQLAPTFGDVFSYCLVSFAAAIATTSPLIIGSAQPSDELKNLSYTPLIHNKVYPSFYYVDIEDMSIDGKKLNISRTAFAIDKNGSGGTIMDSGTTLYFMNSEAFQPLQAALKPLINYPTVEASELGFNLCYSVMEKPVFPTITVHFTGADWVVPQENSFAVIDDEGTTCFTAIPTNEFSIIGNLWQQNFLFVYDRANAMLGFGPKKCDQR